MTVATDYELLSERAGVVARPGRAVVEVTGEEAAEFLQSQVTNDVEALAPGEGCYAALLDPKGKLRTDVRILRLAAERFLCDTEPEGRRVLTHTIEMYSLGRDVGSIDRTEQRVVLSAIGPTATEALGAHAPAATEEHACAETDLGVVAVTDLGFDVFAATEDEARVRETLGLPDASEEAAETLRVEHGRPRLLRDMDASTMPQEAGINERAVSFTKGCYPGQETVARLHYKGKPNRHLRGLRLGAAAERGTPITLGEKEVGAVGSAVLSPSLGPIALALVRREAEPGTEVLVGGEPATVVELPFATG